MEQLLAYLDSIHPIPPDLKEAIKHACWKQLKRKVQIRRTLAIIENEIRTLTSGSLTQRVTCHRIAVPLLKELRFIDPGTITRCEASNNYTHFYLEGGEKLIVSRGLYEFANILAPYGIIRCHQSHLVNLFFIKSLLRKKEYVNELLLTDGTPVPVSRLRLDAVIKAMTGC